MNPASPRDDRSRGRRGVVLLAVFAAILAALVLSACGGGGSSSSDGSETESSEPAGEEEGGAKEAGTGEENTSSPEAEEFLKYTGISAKAAEALKGQEFKVGAILPLSGPGAAYSTEEQNGIVLAADEMKEYLGMDVKYEALDHKSGDPQAGAAAARQLGIEGFGVAVNSYYGVFGSTLPEIQKYKMLSIDPGGGTGNGLKGKEYFYGMRANTPDDGFPALQYFKENEPQRKKVAMVIWDAGAEYVEPIEEHIKEEVSENGMTYTGTIKQKIGATNYSSVISELKNMNPDIIWLTSYGADPAYFMKEYVNSGLKAQVIGAEYTPAAAKIAGAAYDQFDFANDFFNFEEPPNPFSKFFMKQYEKQFSETPNIFYEPNYYETGIAYAVLAARVAENGGDINSGEELNKALEEEPSVPSVYGGTPSEVGTFVWNLETHDPEKRPVSLVKATTPPVQLAEWNVGGTEFKVLSE
jgi:ABC-type branched-subunit amino acid transport system substrate-binding protein